MYNIKTKQFSIDMGSIGMGSINFVALFVLITLALTTLMFTTLVFTANSADARVRIDLTDGNFDQPVIHRFDFSSLTYHRALNRGALLSIVLMDKKYVHW